MDSTELPAIIGKDLTKEEQTALARSERQLATLFAELGEPVSVCQGFPTAHREASFFDPTSPGG